MSRGLLEDWAIVAVLYGLTLVLYRLLGNFAAAGEVLRRWGRHSAGGHGRSSGS